MARRIMAARRATLRFIWHGYGACHLLLSASVAWIDLFYNLLALFPVVLVLFTGLSHSHHTETSGSLL